MAFLLNDGTSFLLQENRDKILFESETSPIVVTGSDAGRLLHLDQIEQTQQQDREAK